MTDLYAVIGNPINHSKSPLIHSLFSEQTKQGIIYSAIQAPMDGFAKTVKEFLSNKGKGLNVTVPFKVEAFQLADYLTERAKCARAVNTLILQSDGMLLGDNTDGAGLVQDITVNHDESMKKKRILLIGAGGAVRGVVAPIINEQPSEIIIANRTASKAKDLAADFMGLARSQQVKIDSSSLGTIFGVFDIVINGTSSSLHGQSLDINPSVIGKNTVCYDMMYSPTQTLFNQWAISHGAVRTLDGVGMLVEQAAESFFVWRGVRPSTSSVLSILGTINK
jgi:shikimate dehydrogenase